MTTVQKNILQSVLDESKTINQLSGFKNQKAYNFIYKGETFTVWHVNRQGAKHIFDYELQEIELEK